MNPFGWRCMGTLFGVLMLPLMCLLAKRMFHQPLFALIPTALSLDFIAADAHRDRIASACSSSC